MVSCSYEKWKSVVMRPIALRGVALVLSFREAPRAARNRGGRIEGTASVANDQTSKFLSRVIELIRSSAGLSLI